MTRTAVTNRALADGKVSTNVYLRRIHNHALGIPRSGETWLPEMVGQKETTGTKSIRRIILNAEILEPKQAALGLS